MPAEPDKIEPIPPASSAGLPTLPQQQNQFSPDAYGESFHTEYSSEVTYYRIEGRRVYASAGPATDGSQPGVVIQEHSPVEKCVITWIGQRVGAAPKSPSPTLKDANFVLTDRKIGVPTPVLAPNGLVRLWVLSGTYFYDMIVPGAVVRDFPGLGMPIDQASPDSNKVPRTAFTQDMGF